jgi:signal transduction histidine kinase
MRGTWHSAAYRYAAAIIAVILATLARMWLDPLLGDQAAFTTYFVAIMFTAWYGGFGPSLVAMVSGAVLADYFFIPPRGSIFFYDWVAYDVEHQVAVVLYFLVGIVMAVLSESLHASRRRVEAALAQLKASEEQVRLAQTQLLEQQRRQREQMEAELVRVKDQLVRQTRLAAIGQVSASIAHDLRNPLSIVRNAVFLLRRSLPQDQPQWARYVELIDQEIDKTSQIITDLMETARAKEPQKEEIDLEATAREVFGKLEHAGNVRLQVRLDPQPFLIVADPVQLRQVLGNLMVNAVQAMSEGGEIRLRAGRDGQSDRIVFEDDGPGIPRELRERVFEPLVTTKPKGTGLGLAICRQIIERHGGTIALLDSECPGAAFEICLPRPALAAEA